MFKKKPTPPPQPEAPKEKPTPAFLRPDYPYPAIGEPITNLSTLKPTGVLYEIKCQNAECGLCARSQGVNIPRLYEKLTTDGCMTCHGKDFVVREVDMSKMEKNA